MWALILVLWGAFGSMHAVHVYMSGNVSYLLKGPRQGENAHDYAEEENSHDHVVALHMKHQALISSAEILHHAGSCCGFWIR